MGKASKALIEFINSIPDDKLTGLPTVSKSNVYSDNNFRFDMQGMTSDNPAKHNLQVQVNNKASISTLKKLAPKTVAAYIADKNASAETVRAGLIAGREI